MIAGFLIRHDNDEFPAQITSALFWILLARAN